MGSMSDDIKSEELAFNVIYWKLLPTTAAGNEVYRQQSQSQHILSGQAKRLDDNFCAKYSCESVLTMYMNIYSYYVV